MVSALYHRRPTSTCPPPSIQQLQRESRPQSFCNLKRQLSPACIWNAGRPRYNLHQVHTLQACTLLPQPWVPKVLPSVLELTISYSCLSAPRRLPCDAALSAPTGCHALEVGHLPLNVQPRPLVHVLLLLLRLLLRELLVAVPSARALCLLLLCRLLLQQQ